MAELHSKRALNVTLIIISQMFPSNSEWMPKKTHRHSCNHNLIGCECRLCEGLRREGVNALCPPPTPIPHARNLHPGYHNAIPEPLLSSLRKTHLCSRPITHAWEGGVSLSNLNKMCVTKAEYDEHGKNICRERFESSRHGYTSLGTYTITMRHEESKQRR